MGFLHIPRKHLIQPQGRVKVAPEWESRLASLLYFGGGHVRDVVDLGAQWRITGGAISPTPHGLGLKTAISGMQYAEASGAMARFSGNFTLVMFFAEIGASQDVAGGMMFAIPAASQYTQLANGGGYVYFAGGGPYVLPSNPQGTRNTSIILRGAGSDPAFFVNRGKSSGVTASMPSGAKTVRVGAWSSSGWQFDGTYGSVAVVKGETSDIEAYALADAPWMFYAADPIRFYSLPSGGTSQDLAGSGAAMASGSATLAAQIALAGVGVSLASGTATLAGSMPLAAAGASAASGTASPKIDIALSALGLTVASGTAALSSNASGSLAAAGSATAGGSAAAVANVTISASGLAQAAAQAGLAASVLLAGAGAAAASGNAALAVQLQALAQGAAQASGTATLQGSTAGQLSASGPATAGGSAALRLDVRLQAAGGAQAGGSGALSAGDAASLAASGGASASGAGTIAAQVTLTGAGFVQAMGAGSLRIEIELGAVGAGTATGTAALSVLLDIDTMPMPTLVPAARVCRIPHRSRVLTIG